MSVYCGLVGNPHLTAQIYLLPPFQRQPRKNRFWSCLMAETALAFGSQAVREVTPGAKKLRALTHCIGLWRRKWDGTSSHVLAASPVVSFFPFCGGGMKQSELHSKRGRCFKGTLLWVDSLATGGFAETAEATVGCLTFPVRRANKFTLGLSFPQFLGFALWFRTATFSRTVLKK